MKSSSLRARVSVLLSGHLGVVFLQAAQFLLLARMLGAEEFGRVAAVSAMVTVAGPLSGFSYGNVMLMHVSRDFATAPLFYGNAIFSTLSLGTLLVALSLLISPFIGHSDVNLWVVLWMTLGELVAVRLCMVSAQLYQATDKVRQTSLINIAVSCCRLAAITPLFWMARPSAEMWAMTAALLLTCLACTVVYFSVRQAGGFQTHWRTLWEDRSDAFHFTMSIFARAAYTDVDKIFLGAFHSPMVLGAYSSAYRLVVMAYMPIRALLEGVASRFFKIGAQGGHGTYALAKRLHRYTLPCGIVMGIGMYLFAPWLPWVLGESYRGAVDVLQLLCFLPPIQATHSVFSDALTGAGFQKLRTKLQFTVLAIYVVLGWVLIPEYGWMGAAWTCLLSESLLAMMVFTAAKLKAAPSALRAAP